MTSFTKYYKQIEVLKSRTFSQAVKRADKLHNIMISDMELSTPNFGILLVYMNTIVDMKEAEERCANFI